MLHNLSAGGITFSLEYICWSHVAEHNVDRRDARVTATGMESCRICIVPGTPTIGNNQERDDSQ